MIFAYIVDLWNAGIGTIYCKAGFFRYCIMFGYVCEWIGMWLVVSLGSLIPTFCPPHITVLPIIESLPTSSIFPPAWSQWWCVINTLLTKQGDVNIVDRGACDYWHKQKQLWFYLDSFAPVWLITFKILIGSTLQPVVSVSFVILFLVYHVLRVNDSGFFRLVVNQDIRVVVFENTNRDDFHVDYVYCVKKGKDERRSEQRKRRERKRECVFLPPQKLLPSVSVYICALCLIEVSSLETIFGSCRCPNSHHLHDLSGQPIWHSPANSIKSSNDNVTPPSTTAFFPLLLEQYTPSARSFLFLLETFFLVLPFPSFCVRCYRYSHIRFGCCFIAANCAHFAVCRKLHTILTSLSIVGTSLLNDSGCQ